MPKHKKMMYKRIQPKDPNSSMPVMDLWNEIRSMIDPMELDAFKNGVKHQLSPGTRFRHALRALRKKISELIMLSSQFDKEIRAKRRKKNGKGRDPRVFTKK